ncbi:Prp39p KNAG_0G00380 [Huiozyma naganishii CBS 8797]|uniref:Suppressor of forked domain-containing protein n=1 Tax=Huiozyma naganishii (strain ATCC MYA-139 / BCRC 22969 / CBS 8797 / KCTC 17520 / NBRC 10181 / NCYC 3082 / Yp74L-3) TaxID=1071383 RepID=J7R8A7_HUIN7|nr:hypothetical protein KNAG_0G00380 [Kazachstania naganishii CBS 8797]CCK71095.1 hypothetical protein KNAG_0G00380 [Kazachstania naganishii CBS 8797]
MAKREFSGTYEVLSLLDRSFLTDNMEFVEAYNAIDEHDINTLNTVLRTIDKIVQKYPTPNDKIKTALVNVFREILGRYPYLYGYWKKLTAVQYQLNGLDTSLKTLEAATEAFPSSADLWCDYLRVLIVNFPDETKLIEEKLSKGQKLVGWQFYSHPYWDLALDYYARREKDLIPLYWEIVEVPLHQYAKYIVPFKKLLNDPEDIQKVQKTIEANQKLVGELWHFEKNIKQNFFNLTPLPQSEINNWNAYLQYLIAEKKSKKLIQSVFERCLVPCCFLEQVWIKYTGWYSTLENSLVDVIEIYERANKLLPTNQKLARYTYLGYLKKEFNDQKHRKYVYDAITKLVGSYMTIWRQETVTTSYLMAQFLPLLKRFSFPLKHDQPAKDILNQQFAYTKMLEAAVTSFLNENPDDTIPLHTMINEGNVAVVAVELIKATWLILKNVLQTRKYFNSFSKVQSIRNSTSFWLTYYKFEKCAKNFSKLNKFINDLGTNIILPVSVINDIISDYETFFLTNSTLSNYRSLDSKNSKDRNTIVDPILYSKCKINKPTWTPSKQQQSSTLDWYKTSEFKENGHPSIIVERPQITNTIVGRSIKSFGLLAPKLPSFRNLEKINQPPKYKDYYTDDYVGK